MAATIQVLRQEHQLIRQGLDFAEGLSIHLEGGEQVPIDVLARVMTFFRLFVEP